MNRQTSDDLIAMFYEFAGDKLFPCAASRSSIHRQQSRIMIAEHMSCPKDDSAILKFVYDFTDAYRGSAELFHSAVVIFRNPLELTEEIFDKFLWQRLQALADADQKNYIPDQRVSSDPSSPDFSFSLKEEAFFVIGMHPGSHRRARNFAYPAIIFNPHSQFGKLKQNTRFDKLKAIIRKQDLIYSGSVNPMLDDHGVISEARQYTGSYYPEQWKCPLKYRDGKSEDYTAP